MMHTDTLVNGFDISEIDRLARDDSDMFAPVCDHGIPLIESTTNDEWELWNMVTDCDECAGILASIEVTMHNA
jgi:hypothetical protein